MLVVRVPSGAGEPTIPEGTDMSTMVYGLLTKRRLATESGVSSDTGRQGLSTAIDAIAALVPAEVLALHATIVGLSTTATDTPQADGTTDITTTLGDASVMSALFWALLATSVAFYAIPVRPFPPTGVGWYRLAIPPLAFLAWSVMQDGSLFYAAFPGAAGWPPGFRLGFALIVAALVGTVAKQLGVTADLSNARGETPAAGEGATGEPSMVGDPPAATAAGAPVPTPVPAAVPEQRAEPAAETAPEPEPHVWPTSPYTPSEAIPQPPVASP